MLPEVNGGRANFKIRLERLQSAGGDLRSGVVSVKNDMSVFNCRMFFDDLKYVSASGPTNWFSGTSEHSSRCVGVVVCLLDGSVCSGVWAGNYGLDNFDG